MAETAVKNAACETCGAEIRNESVFCFNCGKPVVTAPAEVEKMDGDPAPAPSPAVRLPLRSAASLRKMRRASNRQPIEITWEPVEKSPAIFIGASVVLALGAAILIFLALYLR